MWNSFYSALEISDTDISRKQEELFNPAVYTWGDFCFCSVLYLEYTEQCVIIKQFLLYFDFFINHILDIKLCKNLGVTNI